MSSVTGTLRRMILRIPERSTRVVHRRFHCDDDRVRDRLESIGRTFVTGYHDALAASAVDELAARLDAIDAESRGWGYEGAGLGLAVRDGLAPWRGSLLETFLRGPGAAHAYMVHVGAGWALGHFRRRTRETLNAVDPLLAWLAIDGFGFRAGYFHWRRFGAGGAVPSWITGVGRRVFDQGLGRSLWFVGGADVPWIGDAVDAFPESRRGDFWSGLGLACAYAGGVEPDVVARLAERAGRFRAHAGQGAAFAAQARRRAGNRAPHTERAVEILCGATADRAASMTDAALAQLPATGDQRDVHDGTAYEGWRAGIRALLVGVPAELTT